MSLDDFDFEIEFANLRYQYPLVSCDRAISFYEFLSSKHSETDYRIFLKSLYGDEYFFVFDLELLLHRRSLQRLRKMIIHS